MAAAIVASVRPRSLPGGSRSSGFGIAQTGPTTALFSVGRTRRGTNRGVGTWDICPRLRGGGDPNESIYQSRFCRRGMYGLGDSGISDAARSGERPRYRRQRRRDSGEGRPWSRPWSYGPRRKRSSLRMGPGTRPSLRLVPTSPSLRIRTGDRLLTVSCSLGPSAGFGCGWMSSPACRW